VGQIPSQARADRAKSKWRRNFSPPNRSPRELNARFAGPRQFAAPTTLAAHGPLAHAYAWGRRDIKTSPGPPVTQGDPVSVR